MSSQWRDSARIKLRPAARGDTSRPGYAYRKIASQTCTKVPKGALHPWCKSVRRIRWLRIVGAVGGGGGRVGPAE